jgi:hypothetical protein
MAEHQLNRPDVHVLCQEATRALVTEVVPVQVDLPQFGAVDARTGFRALRLVPVGDQKQRLPGRLEVGHELDQLTIRTRTRLGRETRDASGRAPSVLLVEWNATILASFA